MTVLKGIRSVTVAESLETADELKMTRWLGRPCPIVAGDGGPTLAMDFDEEQLSLLLQRAETAVEIDKFQRRVRRVRRDGVLVKESFDEAGFLSISAPIRDAAGTVAAAACLVGLTDRVEHRLSRLKEEAGRLADQLSRELQYEPAP